MTRRAAGIAGLVHPGWRHPVTLTLLLAISSGVPAEVRVLAHGDFQVAIEIPADRHLAHFGPRFDRTAAVSSVMIEGDEFLGPWGLSDEFGLYGLGVLGYESATVGGHFVKIGVGILVRDIAGRYDFAHPYPVHALFPVETRSVEDRVVVIQQSDAPGFPGYRYQKAYEAGDGNTLTIHYHLANTGDAEWAFEHYNHHWFRHAGEKVGPSYQLSVAFPLPDGGPTAFHRGSRTLQLPAYLGPGQVAYYASDLDRVTAADNGFELSLGAAASVRYQGSFTPARFAAFASDEGFCPEVFKRAVLQPGEAISWSATYQFQSPP